MLHLQGLPGPLPKMVIIWAADFDFYPVYENSVHLHPGNQDLFIKCVGHQALVLEVSRPCARVGIVVGRVGPASLKTENCWTHAGGLTKAMTVPANKPLAGTQYLLPPAMTLFVNYPTPPTPPCPSTASGGKGLVCLVQLRLLSASMVPGPRSGWRNQG